MPTYEYRCPNGHEFELFQKMSEDPVASCPECGEESQRLLSAGAGLLFKGEGFYITDYRSDSYKKAASSEKDGSGKSGGAVESEGGGKSKKTDKTDKTGTSGSSTSDPKTSSKGSSSDG
jgi:putative FmdB family regulatory protein